MLVNATDFFMMLACTGFVVLTANVISKGFERLWSHVYAAPQAMVAEPILDERHLLPPGRDFEDELDR